MTVLILFGSPSITLLSLSLLTDIISLTNLTVKNNAVAVFSKFSTIVDPECSTSEGGSFCNSVSV